MKCIKKIEINKDQLEMVTGGLGYETGPLGTELPDETGPLETGPISTDLIGIRVKATGPLDENIDYPHMSILGVRV